MFCCCAGDAVTENGAQQVTAMPVASEYRPYKDPSSIEAPAEEGSGKDGKEADKEQGGHTELPKPAADAPPRFVATIMKGSGTESVGWQVDIVDNQKLYLCRILGAPSPLQTYNASVSEDRQLKIGDYIMQVNDAAGSVNSMMQISRTSPVLNLVVQRPRVFAKTVFKDGGSLGLALTHAKGCPSLCIEDIKDGAVSRSAPDVMVGDRIISVNGTKGDSETLMKAIQKADTLELEFSRAG
mmetsp:Transcript_37143/g.78797  ORF Transcript_37143/g.78797 Transcript_37143/m.78797 type:complete len:240 (-) Transcript_37143:29-748(-)